MEKVRLRTAYPGNWEVLLTIEEAASFFHAPLPTKEQIQATRELLAGMEGKADCAFSDFVGRPWLWSGKNNGK